MPKTTFFARADELSVLVDRCLNTGESTAIVSEFPSGRTTLLAELQRQLQASNCRIAYIDVQILDQGTTPEQLWAEVLKDFGGARPGRSGFRELQHLVNPPAGKAELQRHVLLIRDFPGLIQLPKFRNGDPWGKLRGLTQSRNFSLVVTSRLDLDALTKESQEWMHGSPFFNAFREMVLGPFMREEAERYLASHRPRLPEPEVDWILRCTGGHPKLLKLLGEALEQTIGANFESSRARREALARCRRDTRVVLHNAWLFFPWQERWMLLCTALRQWAGSSLAHLAGARVLVPETVPTPDQLIHAMERQLSRDELRRVLLMLLPNHINALPGAGASDLDYFTRAAELLLRHEAGPVFFNVIERAREATKGEAPWQLTNRSCERLSSRGILASTERPPGWHITPPLFYWWVLDQLHELAIVPRQSWLLMHRLEQHIATSDIEALRAQVMRHESLVREGATRLVEEEIR